ncbi:ORF3 [Equine circovirus 1]|uniref:ORF3 n=1 Tax=Equine circovirus 1 TaxID=2834422 RepID=A0A8E7SNG6_9CIRC|nr:ORF3 [Equine circovirus 1]QWA14500.1 ORF3 [Equine circovirus 1]
MGLLVGCNQNRSGKKGYRAPLSLHNHRISVTQSQQYIPWKPAIIVIQDDHLLAGITVPPLIASSLPISLRHIRKLARPPGLPTTGGANDDVDLGLPIPLGHSPAYFQKFPKSSIISHKSLWVSRGYRAHTAGLQHSTYSRRQVRPLALEAGGPDLHEYITLLAAVLLILQVSAFCFFDMAARAEKKLHSVKSLLLCKVSKALEVGCFSRLKTLSPHNEIVKQIAIKISNLSLLFRGRVIERKHPPLIGLWAASSFNHFFFLSLQQCAAAAEVRW